jgi:hypothetical protein
MYSEGMADDTLFDHFKALPTREDLRRWEEEHARMGRAIHELNKKREQLGEMIKIAASIHGGPEAAGRGVGGANNGPLRAGTWMSAIHEIVERHPGGAPYELIRNELPEPFASKLSRDPSAKSFYGAMGKLEDAGLVVRHKTHLFLKGDFEEHMRKVEAGEIPDVEGRNYRGSPMADAVKAFLLENPRSKATVIRDHLCKVPEFRKSLRRNTSTIYNLLKKLKDREELIHHEDGTYSLMEENEASSSDATDASEAGEGATSPNETQPPLRVVR